MAAFVLRDTMRAIHLLAGAAWVGGSLMYLLVILPALRIGGAPPAVGATLATLFRRLVNLCIGALLISGAYLTFDRLASATVGAAYVATLVVKTLAALTMIALALYQAQLARRLAKRRGPLWRALPRWILGLGILTFILGVILTGLFESTLGLGR